MTTITMMTTDELTYCEQCLSALATAQRTVDELMKRWADL